MSQLTRKLLHDLVTLRWQIVSIAAVVASGVAIFVSALGTYRSLEQARDRFSEQVHFPHVFVRLSRAPEAVAGELARIDGVAAVEPRLAFDVRLDIEGVREPVSGRVHSLPPATRAPLQGFVIESGRLPEPAERHEVAVNEAFAEARKLALGDRFHAVLNGRREELTIVGTVLSAEYIAALRPGEMLPDDAHYAVLWVPYDALSTAYQATGTFNEAVLWLAPGASEASVSAAVDRVLVPYGGYGALGRSEQPAHRFVNDELRELEVEATILPIIFLGVASFLLNIVLARIIANERTQIATLRALGFRVGPIARHYLALATVTSAAGAVVGVGLGVLIGFALTGMYVEFFRFPDLTYVVSPLVVIAGIATSVAAGAIGALASVRGIARLAPAEAMQPPAPPAFRGGLLSRSRLVAKIPASLQLVAGNVGRTPLRTVTSVIGIAAAMAVLVVGAFWNDALEVLLDRQFRLVQREDATITFVTPSHDRAVRELEHIPGVRLAEGIRSVPARLTVAERTKRVDLLGLAEGSTLHRLVEASGEEIALPPDGVVVSRHLADRLSLDRGSRFTIEVLEGARARRDVTVAAVVDELIGMGAYMDAGALARLLGEAPAVSAALVSIEPGAAESVHAALRAFPGVATVSIKHSAIERFQGTLQRVMVIFSGVLTLFGALVVVGVVYNSARILVAERGRELATLRVVGFTRGDISELLLLELAIQVLVALPIGALLGWALSAVAVRLFGPEEMTIPLIIGPRTWALSVTVVLVSAIVSALLARRRLDRLDLVAVLKARE